MQKGNNPILVVALAAVIALAIGLAVWQYARGQSTGEIPASAYPQPVQGQPTVEEVGPPPDVVPAGTPGSAPTPPPMKGR
jgi:hypothetical protein